jgi:anti-anti-sigma factor
MGIQEWSENVILADLSGEPQECDELQTVIDMVSNKGGCDVVIDFSHVDVVGSRVFCGLLRLQKALHDGGHKLILCGVRPATRNVFAVTRLDEVFEFAPDRFAVLASH